MSKNSEQLPETKETILQAGRDLILSKGYTATSVDAICEAAGITKGAFYYFFKSKAAFAEALLDYNWQPIRQMQVSLGDASTDILALIDEHIDFMAQFIQREGRIMSILGQEVAPSQPDLGAKMSGYFRNWTETLTHILNVASERFEPVDGYDSETLMMFIIMSIEGVPVINKQLGTEAVQSGLSHIKHYVRLLLQTHKH